MVSWYGAHIIIIVIIIAAIIIDIPHFTAVQPLLTKAPASLTKHLIYCSVRHVFIVTVYCIAMY
jgi:hypothetical protein